MADNDIQIQVKVDAQGAITVLDRLGNEIRKVEQVSDATGRGFDFFSNKIVVLNQGLELVSKGFRAVSDGVQKLADLASLGDQVNDVGGAFNELSLKAGEVGDVLLGKLREATQDSVNNLELMKLANDAMTAGLQPDQFIKVAAAAKQYGDALGLDTSAAVNKLSEAIQSGNERQLKQFGIFSDGQEQVKQYTQAMADLGKQVDAGTIAEIKRTAALEALNEKQIETVVGIKGVDDTLATVRTSYENLTQNIGAAFDANTDLALSLGSLKKAFDAIDAEKFGKSLAAIAKIMADMASKVVPALVKEITAFSNGLEVLFGTSKQANAARLQSRIEEIRKEIDYLNKTPHNNTWADKLFGTDSITKIEALNTELDVTQRTYDRLIGELREGAVAESAAAKATEAIAEANKNLAASAKKAGIETSGLSDEMKKAQKEAQAFADRLQENVVDALGSLGKAIATGGDVSGSVTQLGSTAGELIGHSLKDSLSSSITDIFGASGATAGAIAGPAGSLIGSILGSRIGDDINKALKGDFKNLVKDALALPTAGLSYLLPDSIFGGDSEGTAMKKAADKFFADAFEANRLSVIIDGKLTEVSDLVFSGNQDGGLFAGLPAATQQAFNGVGVAFEGLLGIAGDLGVNIGNVFANNVGGSLNNLQLLIEATGVSFEQLGDQVVTTFLNGELSVKQANDALKSIEQIAQKGIPDGLGLIADGFANMQAAGTKGGRAVVDGLQDIGFEAKELGFTTFPEIIKHLEESGRFSSEAIQETFAALEANGIKTIDQLTAATAAELLPALAQLEESGVLTEALEKTAELARSINELPSEKTIVLNVKANVTPEAGAVISAVRTGQANGTPYNQ